MYSLYGKSAPARHDDRVLWPQQVTTAEIIRISQILCGKPKRIRNCAERGRVRHCMNYSCKEDQAILPPIFRRASFPLELSKCADVPFCAPPFRNFPKSKISSILNRACNRTSPPASWSTSTRWGSTPGTWTSKSVAPPSGFTPWLSETFNTSNSFRIELRSADLDHHGSKEG